MSLLRMLAAGGGSFDVPDFVSSSVNNSAVAANTVTAPASIADGDLLVAVCTHESNNRYMSTFPTGFVQQYGDTPSENTILIATKVASGESGNYTFTWDNTGDSTISILVYRTASRIHMVGAITRANSDTAVAASITPTYIGTLCAVYMCESTAKTVVTPPAGMTQRVASAGSTIPGHYVYDQPVGTGATGTKTLEWDPAGADERVASLLFLVSNEPDIAPEFINSASTQGPGGVSSLTINKPTNTADGDLMIAFMCCDNNRTWTGDTGWTEILDNGTNPSVRVAYKIAASEGASYTFTTSSNATSSGSILTYRYASYGTISAHVAGANPLEVQPIAATEGQAVLLVFGAREANSVTVTMGQGVTTIVTDNDATTPSYHIGARTITESPSCGEQVVTVGSISNVGAVMLTILPTRSPT